MRRLAWTAGIGAMLETAFGGSMVWQHKWLGGALLLAGLWMAYLCGRAVSDMRAQRKMARALASVNETLEAVLRSATATIEATNEKMARAQAAIEGDDDADAERVH